MMLQTDRHNKNVKRKMQKQDYLKNLDQQGIAEEILGCFYDNISYTPFVHVDEEDEVQAEKSAAKKKKALLKAPPQDPAKKAAKEPVDPYEVILEKKLEILRPNLKDVMHLEDTYGYLGTSNSVNLAGVIGAFSNSGILQILSRRSRPEAYKNANNLSLPDEGTPGVVNVRVSKVGLLWRKDTKKKKTRSPWQEWGVLLTASQLFFFKNHGWVKTLMTQYEHHRKHHKRSPVVFKPALEEFKPDALVPTDDAVALVDATYKRHKNAFIFARRGGFEETFLADNEVEMNDWLCKINFAATFKTAGVRMRGSPADDQAPRGTVGDGLGSANKQSTGEVTKSKDEGGIGLVDEIVAARKHKMMGKIADYNENISEMALQLDCQMRNARHLQILAPIQPKTREMIIFGAARMQAKLKWLRMEHWRIRCHRDILAMDVEDEHRVADEPLEDAERTPKANTAHLNRIDSKRGGLSRLTSKASTLVSHSPISPVAKKATNRSSKGSDYIDSAFETPPDLVRDASHTRPSSTFEIPPLAFVSQNLPCSDTSQNLKSPRPGLTHQHSLSSVSENHAESFMSQIPSRLATPTPSIRTGEHETKAGSLAISERTPEDRRGENASETEPERGSQLGSPQNAHKVRRSLHRTLRESREHGGPARHASKRGRHSSLSNGAAGGSPPGDSEGLPRSSGSFRVHGKKASVVTFGPEWDGVSAQERMKLLALPQEGARQSSGSIHEGQCSLSAQNGERRHTSAAAAENEKSSAAGGSVSPSATGSPKQSQGAECWNSRGEQHRDSYQELLERKLIPTSPSRSLSRKVSGHTASTASSPPRSPQDVFTDLPPQHASTSGDGPSSSHDRESASQPLSQLTDTVTRRGPQSDHVTTR